MNPREHDELTALIDASWVPAPPDPAGFEAGIARRHRHLKRRRAALGATLAAVALAFLALHLPGQQVPAPAPTDVAQADPPDAGLWWSDAVDPDQRGYELPGTYSALDTLFLQPLDQEM